MKRLALILALVSGAAFAQDIGLYNRGLSAFNAGDFDTSAQTFFEVWGNTTDQELRAKSEYYLAQSLAKKGLPMAAVSWYAEILKAGKAHPYYLKAVEGLVQVQQQITDPYLIPNLLDRNYNDEWATLPLETLARINYMIGDIAQRKAKLEEAKSFLEAVPKESSIHAKAQYLLGIVLGDARFPGGSQSEAALKAFETVLSLKGDKYEELTKTQQLAILALGRTYFGAGQFHKATEAYERIPRFSKYWDLALFENGWARFQNEDYGGALGSLQALHAPQFAGAFQPESWVLKATVYYFSCLYEEADAALAAFDELYQPMDEKLKAVLEGDKDVDFYFQLLTEDSGDRIPKAVINWIRSNERMVELFNLLQQIDDEKRVIAGNSAWQGSKLGADLITNLDSNRSVLAGVAGKLARNRIEDARKMIKAHSDNAEIIRFETSKAEKELAEAGVNQRGLLAKKTLLRPAMPAEDWNYWKFQGEFWIDEIGYYQYTLKKGCPAEKAD